LYWDFVHPNPVPTRRALGLLLGAAALLPGGALASQASSDTPSTATEGALARLAARLRRLEEDGLDPAAYGIPPETLAAGDPAAYAAELRRAASAALADLLHGRVKDLPGRADLRRDIASLPLAAWQADLFAAPEPASVISRAALLPPEAAALKAALARARAVVAAGGWPVITGNLASTLEPGTHDAERVPQLRARLAATDPGVPRHGDTLYDEALVAAMKRFQVADGLEPDGRIGRLSWAALNRPADAVVRQLRVALDMRRAAAPPPAERRIEVNIPHQRLQVIEAGRVLLDMAVIVGKPARATPMLRVRLTSIQFNPPWGVPERNAREDLLPRFRRDPRAMMEKGFRLFGTVDGQRVEIDPTTVDWQSVNPARFPYFVRQDAGDANALGRIKFVIPNSEDIFMHDTPDRHLFRRPDRAFSSGCIRLEKPMELLDFALEGTAGWDRARAQRAIEARSTSAVAVRNTLPVRLHYTTAVVEGGHVTLRPDIYGLDAAYARALDAGRSRATAALGGR
jgi:murein L,D-transpeptidase YcbB/YkuD